MFVLIIAVQQLGDTPTQKKKNNVVKWVLVYLKRLLWVDVVAWVVVVPRIVLEKFYC